MPPRHYCWLAGIEVRIHRIAQQFGQLGFEFVECLVDGQSLQLSEVEAELLREQGFNVCLELMQKLLYFLRAQYMWQMGIDVYKRQALI